MHQVCTNYLLRPRACCEHGKDARAAPNVHHDLPLEEVLVVLDGVHVAHRSHLRVGQGGVKMEGEANSNANAPMI